MQYEYLLHELSDMGLDGEGIPKVDDQYNILSMTTEGLAAKQQNWIYAKYLGS